MGMADGQWQLHTPPPSCCREAKKIEEAHSAQRLKQLLTWSLINALI